MGGSGARAAPGIICCRSGTLEEAKAQRGGFDVPRTAICTCSIIVNVLPGSHLLEPRLELHVNHRQSFWIPTVQSCLLHEVVPRAAELVTIGSPTTLCRLVGDSLQSSVVIVIVIAERLSLGHGHGRVSVPSERFVES